MSRSCEDSACRRHSRNPLFAGLAMIAFVFVPAAAVLADTAPTSPHNQTHQQPQTSEPNPPPYLCGLHCLYAAAILHGKQVEFSSVVTPAYVTHCGSSADQLKKAAAEWDMHTATVRKLTWDVLRESPYPCILHVKSSPQSEAYDHWILLLSVEGDKCKVLDPPNRVEWIRISDLEERWGGIGILVADEPIDMSAFLWPARKRLAVWGMAGLGIAGLGYWLPRHMGSRKVVSQ